MISFKYSNQFYILSNKYLSPENCSNLLKGDIVRRKIKHWKKTAQVDYSFKNEELDKITMVRYFTAW